MICRVLTFVLMLSAISASAQQLDLKPLEPLASKAKNMTEVDMDEAMLKSASSFLKPKSGVEPAAGKQLKGLYVRVYQFNNKGDYNFDELQPLLDQLKEPAWMSFFRNKDEKEQTEVWTHHTGGVADGLLLITAEEKEVVVVNALGLTSIEELAKLGDQVR